jgi:hypothetical protein
MVAIDVLRRPEPTSVARVKRASFDTLLVNQQFVKIKISNPLKFTENNGQNPMFSSTIIGGAHI